MVSQHLKETLDRYHVGDKLKQLRLRRKMGLVELSKHTGLSPALLSKLEHGKLYPTLPTLSRIALVFSIGLDHFFSDSSTKPNNALVVGSSGWPRCSLILECVVSLPPNNAARIPASFNTFPRRWA